MFVITNRIDVDPETAEAFEKAFTDSMHATLKGVPGLHRATLMRPEKAGLPHVSVMEFDTRQHFLDWLRSDSFKASHSDAAAPGMQAPSSVEQHSLIAELRNPA